MRGGFGGKGAPPKGAAPLCVEALSHPFGAIECALIRWLARRGVHQPMTLPAAEIPPTVNLAAAATAALPIGASLFVRLVEKKLSRISGS
jgi:hypothetical protein